MESLGLHVPMMNGGGGWSTTTAWPTNNLGLFVPFGTQEAMRVLKMCWANGTVNASNVDAGVYTETGSLLFHCGNTTQAGATDLQEAAVVLDGANAAITYYDLAPGRYLMGLSCASTSCQFQMASVAASASPLLQIGGMVERASSVALPATISDTWVLTTQISIPVFGFSARILVH